MYDVFIAQAGNYSLAETLTLGPADSNTSWLAVGGVGPTPVAVSGGMLIPPTAWKKAPGNGLGCPNVEVHGIMTIQYIVL